MMNLRAIEGTRVRGRLFTARKRLEGVGACGVGVCGLCVAVVDSMGGEQGRQCGAE